MCVRMCVCVCVRACVCACYSRPKDFLEVKHVLMSSTCFFHDASPDSPFSLAMSMQPGGWVRERGEGEGEDG